MFMPVGVPLLERHNTPPSCLDVHTLLHNLLGVASLLQHKDLKDGANGEVKPHPSKHKYKNVNTMNSKNNNNNKCKYLLCCQEVFFLLSAVLSHCKNRIEANP